MIRLIFECEDTAPVEQIREHLEMYLEQWHDFHLVEVQVLRKIKADFNAGKPPEQTEIGGTKW